MKIRYRNVLWPPNVVRLVREGGFYQIPCLFIDGRPLYESDDIVRFLREHFPPRPSASGR